MKTEAASFHWDRESDLHYLAGASPLMPVRQAVWGLLALAVLAAFLLFPFPGMSELLLRVVTLVVLAGSVLVALYMGYWELHRRLHKVKIDGYRLEATVGVLWKSTGSVHLLPHTTFYVIQDTFWDVVFGLADVHIHPAMTPNPEIVSVHGLPLNRAHQFKSYLTSQIDRQLGTRSKPSVETQMNSALRRLAERETGT